MILFLSVAEKVMVSNRDEMERRSIAKFQATVF